MCSIHRLRRDADCLREISLVIHDVKSRISMLCDIIGSSYTDLHSDRTLHFLFYFIIVFFMLVSGDTTKEEL